MIKDLAVGDYVLRVIRGNSYINKITKLHDKARVDFTQVWPDPEHTWSKGEQHDTHDGTWRRKLLPEEIVVLRITKEFKNEG